MATPEQLHNLLRNITVQGQSGNTCPVCEKKTMLACNCKGSPHFYCTNCLMPLSVEIVAALRQKYRLQGRLELLDI